jgi:hypothetical protein
LIFPKLWHALGHCAHATELVLSGWVGVGERPLRAAGMRLGDHLKRVDLSNTLVPLPLATSHAMRMSSNSTCARIR